MKHNVQLITGATGFVGGFLSHALLESGAKLILLGRNSRDKSAAQRITQNLEAISGKPGAFRGAYCVVVSDVTKPNLGLSKLDLKTLGNVDAVWHCAALSRFHSNEQVLLESVNVNGTRNALNLAREVDAERFHHVSTAYVCGKRRGKIYETELSQKEEPKFNNHYENSKFRAETEVARWMQQSRPKITIYRPGVLIGSSRDGTSISFKGYYYVVKVFEGLRRNILRQLAGKSMKSEGSGVRKQDSRVTLPIRVYCGRSTVNLVTVDHVADQMLKIGADSRSIGKVFHLTNPQPPLARDVFSFSLHALGIRGFSFVDYPGVITDVPNEKPLLRKYEERLQHALHPYEDYLDEEPSFDTENVRNVMGPKFVLPARIDEQLIEKMLGYAVRVNWRSG